MLINYRFTCKTKWLPEQNLNPIEIQNGLNDD